MTGAGSLISAAARRLAVAGVEAAPREARLLLAQAMACSAQRLFNAPETPVPREAQARFEDLLCRRAAGEPLSRIAGKREFWSLEFALSPATLDPRPDSETLIEGVLRRLSGRSRALRILDLGTGSGCLLLALLSEYPSAWGLGIDRSIEAAATAARNAARLGLSERASFLTGDWAAALGLSGGGGFDLIVSNPPYIASEEIEALDPSVRIYDPRAALDGGPDGLDCYRTLLPQAAALLKPGGLLALEIGMSQARAVRRLASGLAGLGAFETLADLAGRDRCVLAAKESMDTAKKNLGIGAPAP
jgi:release factor glutamine methyltransferase